MTDQLRSLDYRARTAEFIGECPESFIRRGAASNQAYPVLKMNNCNNLPESKLFH